MERASINLYNADCLPAMKLMQDNEYDLAIIDPPYGIGIDGDIRIRKPDRPSTWNKKDKYIQKKWDNKIPNSEYWKELFRISKNQIVWGGNYFTEYLKPSKGWVFWDKLFDKTFNFSHGELAWTSFDRQLLKVTKSSKAETSGGKDRIHPTQKPVYLYKWLLNNYTKDVICKQCGGSGEVESLSIDCDVQTCNICRGDGVVKPKIIDTHLGSGSIAIACWDLGFDLTAYEIDKEYFDAASKRLDNYKRQLQLF